MTNLSPPDSHKQVTLFSPPQSARKQKQNLTEYDLTLELKYFNDAYSDSASIILVCIRVRKTNDFIV